MKKIIATASIVLITSSVFGQAPSWKVERKLAHEGITSYSYFDVIIPQDARPYDAKSLKLMEAWAGFCRDTLLVTEGSVASISADAYQKYLEAERHLAQTGEFTTPSLNVPVSDVTKLKWSESLPTGFSVSLLETIPFTPLSKISTPATGILLSFYSPIAKEPWYFGIDMSLAAGWIKHPYYTLEGGNGNKVPYLGAVIKAQRYLSTYRKWQIFGYAGLGYGAATFGFNFGSTLPGALSQGIIHAGGAKLTEGITAELRSLKSKVSFCDRKSQSRSFVKVSLFCDQMYYAKGGFFIPTLNLAIGWGIQSTHLQLDI